MWKATAGVQINNPAPAEDDDWETDPDFVNDVNEHEQRWGPGGRQAGAIDMQQLRVETEQADQDKKKKELEEQNPGYGYGGKFGLEKDRMDKSAVGNDYQGKVEKHASQKDYSEGFGGKFGVQKDRVDKSAAGWDHIEKVEKHGSQKDYSAGFGGKYGVQKDRVDKSAVGWDHKEKVEKHESQKDYSKGFGGKYGVQEDRKDKSAVGWDHIEAPQKHESQVDHKVGFGGKFGVQKDRMDKSAAGYDDSEKQQVGTTYTKVKPNIEGAKPSNLRAKFENLAKNTEEESRKRAEEQKRIREEKDKRDREEASKKTVVENTPRTAAEEARVPPPKGSRSNIVTGREGGIGNAISAFNQMTSPTTEKPPATRREQIIIPKAEPPSAVPAPEAAAPQSPPQTPVTVQQPTTPQIVQESKQIAHVEEPVKVATPQPDVIPAVEVQQQVAIATPPQPLSPVNVEHVQPEPHYSIEEPEPVYQNQAEVAEQHQQQQQQQQQQFSQLSQQTNQHHVEEHNIALNGVTKNEEPAVTGVPEDTIYANSDNLADYIEDTGLHAIALYDYQAADDDEISFDPDDLITHIEMIDEGWWRGLCKNRYGLFPANYVHLVNQQQT